MKPYKIEKAPPEMTDDVQTNLRLLAEHMKYQQEQMNFILTLIYKQMNA